MAAELARFRALAKNIVTGQERLKATLKETEEGIVEMKNELDYIT